MNIADQLRRQIRDQRSGRVIFLSHCILNANTRYLGGACRPGAIAEIVTYCVDHDLGIVQLPCPEEAAWGGVLKRLLLRSIGARTHPFYPLRGVMLPVFLGYTRLVFGGLAGHVARQISDYRRAGIEVAAIVGIDGSPSCGVSQTLAIRDAAEGWSAIAVAEASAERLNEVIRQTLVPGTGIFIRQIERALIRRRLKVPFIGHSLLDELMGISSKVPEELNRWSEVQQ